MITMQEMLEKAAEFHQKEDWPQFAEATIELQRSGMAPDEIMRRVKEINNPTPHLQRLSETKLYLPTAAAAVRI